MRVLIVEDDRKVASFLEKGLREEGYSVDVAHDGDEGYLKARVYEYDAAILDVMLPGKSGLEVTRALRTDGIAVPILLLTAMNRERDIVLGLDLGADDYLGKPFGFDELLARLRALVRRGGSTRDERLAYETVVMDRLKHTASRGGHKLDLTPKEFQLLEYFLLHVEQVVRRTQLLEKVWDLRFDPMSNVVDVHVGNLRRKLRANADTHLLHTVRGVGYIFQREDADE